MLFLFHSPFASSCICFIRLTSLLPNSVSNLATDVFRELYDCPILRSRLYVSFAPLYKAGRATKLYLSIVDIIVFNKLYMVGPERAVRRSGRNRQQVLPFQAPPNRNNYGVRGRPRNEENERDVLNGVIIRTPSVITNTSQSFTALQKKFPSKYSDLVKFATAGGFNLAQFLFGPHFNQLLAENTPEHTLSVAKDIGAMRLFVSENGPPIGDEWSVKRAQFQSEILDQMGRLPKLYVPVEDDEITQDVPFCFEINPDLSERNYLKQLDTSTTNFIKKCVLKNY